MRGWLRPAGAGVATLAAAAEAASAHPQELHAAIGAGVGGATQCQHLLGAYLHGFLQILAGCRGQQMSGP